MRNIKKAILISLSLFMLCGFAYPLAMTGISQVVFSKQANGSIMEFDGKEIGSALLGQDFQDPRFFYGRISAVNYNTYSKEDTFPDENRNISYGGVSSGSQNLAPSNKDLLKRVDEDINAFIKSYPGIKKEDIPTDLLTSSGSGLDPHISTKSAAIQIPFISQNTGIPIPTLEKIVQRNTEKRSLNIFGEPRVNVLKLNIKIAELLEDTR